MAIKICADCKYSFTSIPEMYKGTLCKKASWRHKIDGYTVYPTAESRRGYGGSCGLGAKDFEPSRWFRFKTFIKELFK